MVCIVTKNDGFILPIILYLHVIWLHQPHFHIRHLNKLGTQLDASIKNNSYTVFGFYNVK